MSPPVIGPGGKPLVGTDPAPVFCDDDSACCGPCPVTPNFRASQVDLTPCTFQFTDLSTAASGAIVGWLWDFGDTNSSTAQNPSHTYGAAATYNVTLRIEHDSGCFDQITQAVTCATQCCEMIQHMRLTIAGGGPTVANAAESLCQTNCPPVTGCTSQYEQNPPGCGVGQFALTRWEVCNCSQLIPDGIYELEHTDQFGNPADPCTVQTGPNYVYEFRLQLPIILDDSECHTFVTTRQATLRVQAPLCMSGPANADVAVLVTDLGLGLTGYYYWFSSVALAAGEFLYEKFPLNFTATEGTGFGSVSNLCFHYPGRGPDAPILDLGGLRPQPVFGTLPDQSPTVAVEFNG